jgi:hypothetical protein
MNHALRAECPRDVMKIIPAIVPMHRYTHTYVGIHFVSFQMHGGCGYKIGSCGPFWAVPITLIVRN